MAIAQFSGLASGIDSKSLIDAIIEARLQTNEIRKADVEFLTSENEALDEFNTKLLALNDLIDKFRTANGGGVSKKSSSSDASVASASVSAAANNGSYSLTVTSVAATATASFTDTYSATTSAIAASAVGTQTVSIDIGTGSNLVNVSVDVTSATTLTEFVDAFNADADASGRAVASVVNVGTTSSPSYKVVFNTLKEGAEQGTIAFTVPVMTELQTQTVSQATNAVFSVSGISGSITRASNSVSDVMSGVSFQLSKAGTATINIGNDADTTADLFKEIVDGYNDIVSYVNENNVVTRQDSANGAANIYGSLAKATIDDDFLRSFREQLSAATSTTGTSVLSMSELGLATNRDGTITLDIEKFKSAVLSDAAGSAEVLRDFADNSAGISGFIYQYTTYEGFIDNAQNANNSQIESLNDKIEQLERTTDKVRQNLEGQFQRLESLSAKLQSSQQALTGILAGLGG